MSEFDAKAALDHLSGAEPPAAAGGAPDAPPPAAPPDADPARAQAARREEALAMVAEYRAAHPGDPRTDAQLLVAPCGGYELLARADWVRPLIMARLAAQRPRTEEAPK